MDNMETGKQQYDVVCDVHGTLATVGSALLGLANIPAHNLLHPKCMVSVVPHQDWEDTGKSFGFGSIFKRGLDREIRGKGKIFKYRIK